MPQSNDPWYSRTEFWTMVATIIGAITGTNVSTNPVAQNVGLGLTAAAPLLYMWGRSNVKVAQASAAASAAAKALGQAK